MRRSLAGALGLAVAALLAPDPGAAQDRLPDEVLRVLARHDVPADALAAVALPLGHWGRAWRHRAEVPMQPASTLKLVTSVVALERLGPNHRGHTELRSAALLAGAVLQGDLVLKGGADPELGIAQFWALLMELRAQGVAEIAGDLLVDRTLFKPARMDLGLPPFDSAPEFPYNVIPDALGLAGALMPLQIDSRSGAVVVTPLPALEGIELRSALVPNERPCNEWSDAWLPALISESALGLQVELQGGFPQRCTRRAALQLVDRQRLTEALFRTLWHGLGGRFAGQVREAAAPPGTRVLVRRESRPWGELMRNMNKVSDNAQTRLLFLSLGLADAGKEPALDTRELAERVVRQWFTEHRIDTPGLVLDNGSGLSRSERIAPLTLAHMLQVAWHGRYASELTMSLPVAGVDGTMRLRLRDSPAAGWARLKTGTLANVRALAGFLRDARGRPWAVAMMINHERAAAARPALDALVDFIARGEPNPPAPAPGPQGDGP